MQVKNKEEFEKEFKELFKNENHLRDEWRELRAQMEALVQPITNHIEACNKFWAKHCGEADEVLIMITLKGTKSAVSVMKPKKEVASIETYLPFGIDYQESSFFDCE